MKDGFFSYIKVFVLSLKMIRKIKKINILENMV